MARSNGGMSRSLSHSSASTKPDADAKGSSTTFRVGTSRRMTSEACSTVSIGHRGPAASRGAGVFGGSIGFLVDAVLLELVAEGAEGHLQQLGRLGVVAAGHLERALQVTHLDVGHRRVQVEALLPDRPCGGRR